MHQVCYTLEPATNHKFPSHPECPERVEAVRNYFSKTLALHEGIQVYQPRGIRFMITHACHSFFAQRTSNGHLAIAGSSGLL